MSAQGNSKLWIDLSWSLLRATLRVEQAKPDAEAGARATGSCCRWCSRAWRRDCWFPHSATAAREQKLQQEWWVDQEKLWEMQQWQQQQEPEQVQHEQQKKQEQQQTSQLVAASAPAEEEWSAWTSSSKRRKARQWEEQQDHDQVQHQHHPLPEPAAAKPTCGFCRLRCSHPVGKRCSMKRSAIT